MFLCSFLFACKKQDHSLITEKNIIEFNESKISANSLTVSWNDVEHSDLYEIKIAGGNYNETSFDTKASISLDDLDENTSYDIAVIAIKEGKTRNIVGEGDLSLRTSTDLDKVELISEKELYAPLISNTTED